MPRTHTVKIWPRFFDAVASGEQTFNIREDDRGYNVGDTLILEEYRHAVGEYTGRKVERIISFIQRWDGATDDPVAHVIMPGWCVLALKEPEA